MQLKTILSGGVMTLVTFTLTYPVAAQPIPAKASNACIQRTAEAMVVATRDVIITGAGPVNAENGVRTLFMRNRTTGQTANCRVNTIDGTVLSVTLTSQNRPSPQPPPMNSLVNACIQRTAEAMVVATRDVELLRMGPINAESGARTLFMRNRTTGQTAECRVNTIDGTFLSVTLTSQTRPPQPVPLNSLINACKQRAAEEMVVAVRDVELLNVGAVNAESGVRTMILGSRPTRQRVECRVSSIDGTVVSVRLIR